MSKHDVAALLSHRQLAAAIDGVADRVVMFDADDRLLLGNKAWWDEQADFGLQPEIGIAYRDYVSDLAASGFIPQAVGKEQEWVSLRLAKRQEAGEAIEVPLANGEVAVIRDHRLPEGGTLTITTTITERVAAESAMAASERRFRDLVENSLQGLYVHRDGKVLFVNAAFASILGYENAAEILALSDIEAFIAPEERPRLRANRERRIRGESFPNLYEYQAIRKDGKKILLESLHKLVDWNDESAIQSIIADVTDRHDAVIALKESESRFRQFAEAASDWYWETDTENRFTALFGGDEITPAYRPEFSIGKTRYDLNSGGDAQDRPDVWRRHLESLDSQLPFRDFVYPVNIGDGKRYWLRTSGVPNFDDNGEFLGYRGVASDITAEILAKERAISTHQQLTTAIKGMSDAVVIWGADDRLADANQAWFDMMSTAKVPASIGVLYTDFLRSWIDFSGTREASGREQQWIDERIQRHRNPGADFEMTTQSGQSFLVRDYALPDGGVMTFNADFTERNRAEAALRENEAQLHQAQKMEVVGQLTGGVAHDFNNLLTVIQGNLELLTDRTADDEIALSFTDAALSSARRGATLTDRLLAFSRKQALTPKIIDADRPPPIGPC